MGKEKNGAEQHNESNLPSTPSSVISESRLYADADAVDPSRGLAEKGPELNSSGLKAMGDLFDTPLTERDDVNKENEDGQRQNGVVTSSGKPNPSSPARNLEKEFSSDDNKEQNQISAATQENTETDLASQLKPDETVLNVTEGVQQGQESKFSDSSASNSLAMAQAESLKNTVQALQQQLERQQEEAKTNQEAALAGQKQTLERAAAEALEEKTRALAQQHTQELEAKKTELEQHKKELEEKKRELKEEQEKATTAQQQATKAATQKKTEADTTFSNYHHGRNAVENANLFSLGVAGVASSVLFYKVGAVGVAFLMTTPAGIVVGTAACLILVAQIGARYGYGSNISKAMTLFGMPDNNEKTTSTLTSSSSTHALN